jgi:sec-independent protein translocase protein TatC
MIALSLALCLLFELAIQVARLNDRRRARRAAQAAAEDLDAPSRIDTAPSRIDPPVPVVPERLDDVT